MVWVRLMHDDPKRVREVAALLLPLLHDSGLLQVGDESEYPNRRGPGIRISFDLTPTSSAGPVRVQAERVDEPARSPARQRQNPARRALPPGSRS